MESGGKWFSDGKALKHSAGGLDLDSFLAYALGTGGWRLAVDGHSNEEENSNVLDTAITRF